MESDRKWVERNLSDDTKEIGIEEEEGRPRTLQVGLDDLLVAQRAEPETEEEMESNPVLPVDSVPAAVSTTPRVSSKLIQQLLLPRTLETPHEPVLVQDQEEMDRKEKELSSLLSTALLDTTSRYFTPLLCRYCRAQGHKFRDCPEKEELCHLCRANHDPSDCPLGNVCYYCFRRGHVKQDCHDFLDRVPRRCEYCGTSGHSTMDCTKVWRRYIKRKDTKNRKELNVWCYYCADRGHFGDFCPRRSGYIAPTAFDFNKEEIEDYRRDAKKSQPDRSYRNSYPNHYKGNSNDRRTSFGKAQKNPKPRYSGGYNQ
jgi:hypothetical protein